MISVELNGLSFQAYHGILQEEKVLGNTYQVDCNVQVFEGPEIIRHIDHTIDYTKVYNIIKKWMAVATPLLETVCMEIGKEIQEKFPDVKFISVTIKKMHPPIEGFTGHTAVTWHKEY